MRCGSYPIFISFTFFSSTLGPTSNTTLFPPPNLIFEVHWSSHILIAQHTQITNVHLSIYKSQFLWIYFIQCSPWYLFNTIYYRHHHSFFCLKLYYELQTQRWFTTEERRGSPKMISACQKWNPHEATSHLLIWWNHVFTICYVICWTNWWLVNFLDFMTSVS